MYSKNIFKIAEEYYIRGIEKKWKRLWKYFETISVVFSFWYVFQRLFVDCGSLGIFSLNRNRVKKYWNTFIKNHKKIHEIHEKSFKRLQKYLKALRILKKLKKINSIESRVKANVFSIEFPIVFFPLIKLLMNLIYF